MSPPAYRTLPARSEPVSAAGGASPCDLRLRTARPDAAPDSAALRIACSAEGFARARAFTRDTLSGWALDHRCDDAVLVMTELASNALAHGSPAAPPGTGEIGLGLALHSGFFTLSVSDTGDDAPVYARPDGPTCGNTAVGCASSTHWPTSGDGRPDPRRQDRLGHVVDQPPDLTRPPRKGPHA